QVFLGWRDVPTDHALLGDTALAAEPAMVQAFVGRGPKIADAEAFERKLYVIRKLFERLIWDESGLPNAADCYFTNLSCFTLIYKGMLTPSQLSPYFPD